MYVGYLRPAIVSHGYTPGDATDMSSNRYAMKGKLLSSYVWDGCRDYSALLTIPSAISLWKKLELKSRNDRGNNVADVAGTSARASGSGSDSGITDPSITNESKHTLLILHHFSYQLLSHIQSSIHSHENSDPSASDDGATLTTLRGYNRRILQQATSMLAEVST